MPAPDANTQTPTAFSLEPNDNDRLINLFGELNTHIGQIERTLGVDIANRGNAFEVHGDPLAAAQAERVLRQLYQQAGERDIRGEDVHLALSEADSVAADGNHSDLISDLGNEVVLQLRRQK
ncbi:MAG: phosphate starvation-inducible protein PhoH, partial [Pseudomonadota bacterium]